MQDIFDSTRKIADIIGVIDGIAFQTNILALNAAVESEGGRSFRTVHLHAICVVRTQHAASPGAVLLRRSNSQRQSRRFLVDR